MITEYRGSRYQGWNGQQPKTFHTFNLRNLAGSQAQRDKLTSTPVGEMGSEDVTLIPAAAETEPHHHDA